jgi:tetratricopeptide (TPR) repeat protein
LPFVELPDGGDGYLAEGVAQELRDQLSREETLLVASTESSVTAAGADTTAAGAARRLDVEGIVQGSVTRVRNRLSISVRLTDTRTERQAWGATLTGVPDEIFALQAAILDSLDRVLQLDDPTATAELRAMRTTDVATHNLYLQGRYAAGDRTPDALERAKTFFLSAIDLDPLYAPAWAALASAHALTGVYEYRSWIDLRPEAQAAAQEAIRLDASLAEAHTARAVLLDYDFRWEEAREAYERAIQLNANDAQAFHWYAVNRVLSGESEQASALIERARELNPLSFTIAVAAGWVYYYQRDFATAVARLESALDLEPNAWVAYQYLGLAYTDLGRYAEGIAALETARELNPSARSLLPGLARAHALAGDLELAGRLLEEARRGGAPMSWLAVGYLSVGDLDEALAWLERARDTGPWNVIEINTFWYDDLRGLPRFEALIADVQPIARVG